MKSISKNINELSKGCYLIVDCNNFNDDFEKFLKNKIGKVLEINFDSNSYIYIVFVTFDNIPNNFKQYFIFNNNTIKIYLNEILLYSDNKEDLELYLDLNKYNL